MSVMPQCPAAPQTDVLLDEVAAAFLQLAICHSAASFDISNAFEAAGCLDLLSTTLSELPAYFGCILRSLAYLQPSVSMSAATRSPGTHVGSWSGSH